MIKNLKVKSLRQFLRMQISSSGKDMEKWYLPKRSDIYKNGDPYILIAALLTVTSDFSQKLSSWFADSCFVSVPSQAFTLVLFVF